MNMFVSSAMVAGAAIPQSVAAEADPIFAAIEAHKAAHAAFLLCVDRHCALEAELPKAQRQSMISIWEEKIVETDDPRWIEAEREWHNTSDAEEEAAAQLVSVLPTTKAGLCALLAHAVAFDTDGEGWPRELCGGDGEQTRTWQTFLIENLATAVPEILA